MPEFRLYLSTAASVDVPACRPEVKLFSIAPVAAFLFAAPRGSVTPHRALIVRCAALGVALTTADRVTADPKYPATQLNFAFERGTRCGLPPLGPSCLALRSHERLAGDEWLRLPRMAHRGSHSAIRAVLEGSPTGSHIHALANDSSGITSTGYRGCGRPFRRGGELRERSWSHIRRSERQANNGDKACARCPSASGVTANFRCVTWAFPVSKAGVTYLRPCD